MDLLLVAMFPLSQFFGTHEAFLTLGTFLCFSGFKNEIYLKMKKEQF